MSEGFELGPFHVPQQSRRDKLRENAFLPPLLYDPSSMLTCASTVEGGENINNFTGFTGVGTGFLSSSSSSSHLFFDLPHQPPVTVAMNSVANCANQDNINQFLCPPQLAGNFKGFDPMLDNSGVTLKPQQLSLSLSSHYKNRQEAARGDPMQRSLMPVGPFTGYAAILKGSRFLKPAQQLLEEFCDVGRRVYMDSSEGETSSSAASLGREMEFLIENSISDDSPTGFGDHGEGRRLKTRLISMLDEVFCLRNFFN